MGDNMHHPLPSAVLFCCDHNSVRSPMAEGLMKKFFGTQAYVQSAGITSDREIDGFSIAVCQEMDVELSRHKVRSFSEMEERGDDLQSFDLVVALSPASRARVEELTEFTHIEILHWPIDDPTAAGETRDQKLASYRVSRDQIIAHMKERWGV